MSPVALNLQVEFQYRLWNYIPETLRVLRNIKYRGAQTLPRDAIAGINHSIIINACCLVEGVFESGLFDVWEHKKRAGKIVEPGLDRTALRRGRVLPGYNDIFKSVTGKRFSEMTYLAPLYEGLDCHFEIRNVLAHSRSINWAYAGSGTSLSPSDENADFEGVYRKVEGYLIKKKLIRSRMANGLTFYPFLSNSIGDHFSVHALSVLSAIIQSLDPEDAAIFERATCSAKQFDHFASILRKTSPQDIVTVIRPGADQGCRRTG